MEEQVMLTARQVALRNWLRNHFISGKYWTIEEMVKNVRNEYGEPYYKLNTNPYIHDKCATLSADIKTINWSVTEGYNIIVKDTKGGAKICESEQEFLEWRERELAPITRKYQYLSNLKYKAKQDGTCPIIDQQNQPVENVQPINVFPKKKEEPKKESKPVQMSIWGW